MKPVQISTISEDEHVDKNQNFSRKSDQTSDNVIENFDLISNNLPDIKNNFSNSNSNFSIFTKENPDNSVVKFSKNVRRNIKLAKNDFDNFLQKASVISETTTGSRHSETINFDVEPNSVDVTTKSDVDDVKQEINDVKPTNDHERSKNEHSLLLPVKNDADPPICWHIQQKHYKITFFFRKST